ncbi:ATP-binding protein involved in chromosome partitioning [Pullulanibacillus pueri]|uniref:Iron-sulfur cluster carrier protein n=1 Tax=Pullulanibacillus pueri TaxID=1437324 RepID=A0A8J2ZXI2_9BACL|nr:Mrp/NBP35 family ATP-binding protein [Pullulanibacillus pueri]MBM7683096.1 ATP-binding protein involved in chromosome partitioning [Pullulanibacillus pueri]GGH85271.1 iron-sulfur cluster carrier protein [Pullulanibacillus pueri]
MMTKEQVLEVLKTVKDPHLHKSVVETEGVREVKISDSFVSVKIALAKTQTAEQMQVQQEIVQKLKAAGAESVGLRFEPLSEEAIEKLGGIPEGRPTLLSKGSKTKFIAIASGKGGVGKSTVSVNLAIALHRLGKKVGILDADIYGFSVPDMMGIENRPQVVDQHIVPVERFGVKVISMGFFVEDNSPVIWRGPMLGKMLNNFFTEVDWGDLDYLILDLPPGTGDIAMDVHSMIPHCHEIIVTTPHATAAFVAARAGAMAIKTEHDILGVIENMSYFESKLTGEKEYVFGQGGGEKLSEVLETDLLGKIPLEQPEEQEGVFAPSVYAGEHKIGQVYIEIAGKVIDKLQ